MWAQQEVDVTKEAPTTTRGGSTLSVVPTADGSGVTLTVDYPEGEGGGANIRFKVYDFSGPLSHITFNARGTLGYARIGVRAPDKQAESVAVAFPKITETMQEYSLDFTPAILAAQAAGQELTYPISELVLGFRFKDNAQDVLEISNVVLHTAE